MVVGPVHHLLEAQVEVVLMEKLIKLPLPGMDLTIPVGQLDVA